MKRSLSFIIAFVLFISLSFSPSAAMEKNNFISNKNFNIIYSSNNNIRTATIYESDGNVNILQINDITGEVTYNGKPFEEHIIYENKNISLMSNGNNWTNPTTSIFSLSFVGFSIATIIGYLNLKYGIPNANAAYIASVVSGAGGFLYVKSVVQFNYVDYSPKVGYRLTETFHIRSDASDGPLYTRRVSGAR